MKPWNFESEKCGVFWWQNFCQFLVTGKYGCTEVRVYPAECGEQLGTDPSKIESSKSLVLKSFSGEGTLWDSSLPVSLTLWDTPALFTPPLPLPQNFPQEKNRLTTCHRKLLGGSLRGVWLRGAWIRIKFEGGNSESRDSEGENSENRDSEGRDSVGRENPHWNSPRDRDSKAKDSEVRDSKNPENPFALFLTLDLARLF